MKPVAHFWWYLIVLVLFLAGVNQVEAGTGASAPSPAAVGSEATCPSLDFRKFFDAFIADELTQRRFTRLPLMYGKTDMLSPGDPFKRRKIGSFQAVPTFDKMDSGRIFPSKNVQTSTHFDVAMKEGSDEDFELPVTEKANLGMNTNGVIVMLYVQDSGFHIYYRFRKLAKCWFLVAIDDKST